MARAKKTPAKKSGTRSRSNPPASKPTAKMQSEIEGTRQKHPRIETLAKDYAEKTAIRQEASAEEVPAKEKLIAAMQAAEVTEYELEDGRRVVMTAEKMKVSIKKAKGTA